MNYKCGIVTSSLHICPSPFQSDPFLVISLWPEPNFFISVSTETKEDLVETEEDLVRHGIVIL